MMLGTTSRSIDERERFRRKIAEMVTELLEGLDWRFWRCRRFGGCGVERRAS